MSVTRTDLARHIGTAFIGGGADRFDLITLARAGRAPEDVLRVLRALPDRRFGRLLEVFDCLADIPYRPSGTGPVPLGVTDVDEGDDGEAALPAAA